MERKRICIEMTVESADGPEVFEAFADAARRALEVGSIQDMVGLRIATANPKVVDARVFIGTAFGLASLKRDDKAMDAGYLLDEQDVATLSAWADAKTTGWGPPFSAALRVAERVRTVSRMKASTRVDADPQLPSGEDLRDARLRLGLSLRDVANKAVGPYAHHFGVIDDEKLHRVEREYRPLVVLGELERGKRAITKEMVRCLEKVLGQIDVTTPEQRAEIEARKPNLGDYFDRIFPDFPRTKPGSRESDERQAIIELYSKFVGELYPGLRATGSGFEHARSIIEQARERHRLADVRKGGEILRALAQRAHEAMETAHPRENADGDFPSPTDAPTGYVTRVLRHLSDEISMRRVDLPAVTTTLRELFYAVTSPEKIPVEVEETPFGVDARVVEDPRIMAALREAKRVLGLKGRFVADDPKLDPVAAAAAYGSASTYEPSLPSLTRADLLRLITHCYLSSPEDSALEEHLHHALMDLCGGDGEASEEVDAFIKRHGVVTQLEEADLAKPAEAPRHDEPAPEPDLVEQPKIDPEDIPF
jgi:hypothetical protein